MPRGKDNGIASQRMATRSNGQRVEVTVGEPTGGNTQTSSRGASGSKGAKRQTVGGLALIVNEQGKRVGNVEHDLRDTKRSVNAIESNLDTFMCSFEDFKKNFSGPPRATTPLTADTQNLTSAPAETENIPRHQNPGQNIPPPASLIREENRHGYLDSLIAREEFRPAPTNGKHQSRESGIVKPYFYIEREGIQTVKQKLDMRASMSLIEYINCFVLLLNDHDAYDQSDKDDMLKHLAAVTTDAMARPWQSVRRWSQCIWDAIEKGKCGWNSHQYIQDERVRVSYSSAPHAPTPCTTNNTLTPPGGGAPPQAAALLCRDYNSAQGCRFTGTHESSMVKYIHACAYCDSMGRRSAHSFQRCRSRLDGQQNNNSNSGYQENRSWNQHQRQHAQHGHHGPSNNQASGGTRGAHYYGSVPPKNV